jgi:transcriptional regulator with XRE-family HTH domain
MVAVEAPPTYGAFMIDSAQIRAARALLGWKQTDLAERSGVSEISIKNIERGATDPRRSTLDAIQQAFESAGLVFLERGSQDGSGKGVRYR